MKKILFLVLLISSISYGQAIAPTRVKITNNVISTSAPFINAQETDGFVNKINKSDLVDVLEFSSATTLPVTGTSGKIYVTIDNRKIYRWNGTFYSEMAITDISNKVDKVTGERLINATEITKLSGIATGATANQTDAYLLNRVNHTGVQEISTVTGLQTSLDAKVDKVTGKSLLSDDEITRLATLANYTHPTNHPPSIITQDASNRFVTDAEKSAWNAKQSALGYTAENVANKNIANGYAGLDSGGKVPLSQINDALLGSVNYKGTYNASTNTPALPASTNKGFYYVVSTAGTQQGISFTPGDWIISDGTAWGKVDNNNAVTSVNGQVGAVVLSTSNITEGSNLYYTDNRVANNSAVLANTAKVTNATHTGDATGSTALTLATVNANVGTFGNATNVAQSTVNAKGLTTAIANVPIQIVQSQVTGLVADLAGKEPVIGTKLTAFNKNFGTTAGTVAEGNDSRILNGQSAFSWGNHAGLYPTYIGTGATGTWNIGISGNAAAATNSTKWNNYENFFSAGNQGGIIGGMLGIRDSDNTALRYNQTAVRDFLGLGSNAYNSTAYLPLTGGTLTAPLFMNNNFMQFRRDGIGTGLLSSSRDLIGGTSSLVDFNAFVYGNNPFGIWTNGNKRVTVGGDGNVGIGIEAPLSKLHSRAALQDDAPKLSSSAAYFPGADVGVMFGQYAAAGSYNSWMQSIRVSDGLAFGLSINPNGGHVIIGGGNTDGVSKLQVNGLLWNKGMTSYRTDGGTGLDINGGDLGVGTNIAVFRNINNVVQYNMRGDGTSVFASSVTATAFYQSSDSRLKTILKRDGDVAYFKWKDGRDNLKHIGWIAQEVKKEYPDQVKKGEDGMLSVNYIEVLVAKIQDLEKRIKQLEKQ